MQVGASSLLSMSVHTLSPMLNLAERRAAVRIFAKDQQSSRSDLARAALASGGAASGRDEAESLAGESRAAVPTLGRVSLGCRQPMLRAAPRGALRPPRRAELRLCELRQAERAANALGGQGR